MKRLRTLKLFQIFSTEIKKSKTYSGWCPFKGLSNGTTLMQIQSGRTVPLSLTCLFYSGLLWAYMWLLRNLKYTSLRFYNYSFYRELKKVSFCTYMLLQKWGIWKEPTLQTSCVNKGEETIWTDPKIYSKYLKKKKFEKLRCFEHQRIQG